MKVVYKIVGYEMKTAEGNFLNSCVFWFYAKDKDEAIKKAKDTNVDKKFYEVIEVIEKDQ